MQLKLNLKLEKQDQRKFPITQSFFVLTKLGKEIKHISWINLYIIVENNNINFFLDIYPISKSYLYYGLPGIPQIDENNINHVLNKIMRQELEILPNGFPWCYSDRKEQFKNLLFETQCVIFWCGQYEIRINRSYQFFDNILEMLKRQ
jgi:hypothetical protein